MASPHRSGRAFLLDALLLLLLALLPLGWSWPLFWPDPAAQMTIVDGDFTNEYFPVLLTASKAIRAGQWPFWNPYSNGGQPLLADPQTALFYPPTWWALADIRDRDGPSLVALERLAPLHLGLAAAFTYLLGRVMLGSRLGAVVAALAFGHSGFLTSYPIEQLPILRAAAWFPLQLLAFWLALERRLVSWALVCGLALGISVLAGHPQTTFLEGVGLAVVGVAWAYSAWVRERRLGPVWRPLLALGVAGPVGLGVGAAQLLPTAEFLAVSNRAQVDFGFLAGGFGLWELPLDLWAPRILGGRPAYVGLVPLVLAASGLALGGGRAQLAAFGLGLTGLLLSAGAHTFLYAALYNLVPGFSLFRGQERSIMLFALGVALLAGAGAARLSQSLSRGELERLARVRATTALLGLGGVGVALALVWQAPQASPNQAASARWAAVIAAGGAAAVWLGAAAALLWMRTSGQRLAAAAPLLAVILAAAELIGTGGQAHFHHRRPDDVYPPAPTIERALADLGPGRVFDEWVLPGSHGLAYGLPTITRTFPLHLERLARAWDRLPPDRLYDLLNVRYISTWQGPAGDRRPLAQEATPQGQRFLYDRPAAGPAWVVGDARGVETPAAALEAVAQPDFDPRRSAIIEGAGEDLPQTPGDGTLISYHRTWNTVEATAQTPHGGYLVLSEVQYPSWRATVNGQPTDLLKANYLLQAIRLPPGTHHVQLTFDGARVWVGLAISVASLVALTAVFIQLGLRRLRPAPGVNPAPMQPEQARV